MESESVTKRDVRFDVSNTPDILDTLALMRDGHALQALWNVVGQVGLSLAGVWIGYRLGGWHIVG